MKSRPRKNAGPLLPGRVVAAHGRRFRIELADGNIVSCVTRGRNTDVACGDRVQIAGTADAEGVIESVEPRSTLFYRSDAYKQKLVAANVTQVLIVVAGRPSFYPELVDRCLAAAEHAGIAAGIVCNKMDLPESAAALEALQPYARLGYRILPLAAKPRVEGTAEQGDIAPLRAALAGHVSVLVGQSGMGKSTLINALLPDAAARTAEISDALDSGRHTTTHAELFHLGPDADLIDSPGLQEFGLHHIGSENAAHAFVELRPWLGQCRFRDCRHLSEPNCAITAAAAAGAISPERLASYRKLAEQLNSR